MIGAAEQEMPDLVRDRAAHHFIHHGARVTRQRDDAIDEDRPEHAASRSRVELRVAEHACVCQRTWGSLEADQDLNRRERVLA